MARDPLASGCRGRPRVLQEVRVAAGLASIDARLFAQQRRRCQVLIDKASKSLFPVVLQRQALERDPRQTMVQLGLKRRTAATLTLDAIRDEV